MNLRDEQTLVKAEVRLGGRVRCMRIGVGGPLVLVVGRQDEVPVGSVTPENKRQQAEALGRVWDDSAEQADA